MNKEQEFLVQKAQDSLRAAKILAVLIQINQWLNK
jgi:hypothetical protein